MEINVASQKYTLQTMFLRNIVWLMSNLCRHTKPPPPMEKVRILLPALAKLLQEDDIQILSKHSSMQFCKVK